MKKSSIYANRSQELAALFAQHTQYPQAAVSDGGTPHPGLQIQITLALGIIEMTIVGTYNGR